MTNVSVTQHINAQPSRVFEVITDIRNADKYIPGIKKIEVVEGSPQNAQVGFTWRETRVMMGKEATETMSITEFNPPRGYKVEAKSGGMHYISTLDISSAPQGGSSLTMTFKAVPQHFWAKLGSILMFMFKRTIVQCFKDDLLAIKKQSESAA